MYWQLFHVLGVQELWKKPIEKRFQEEDVQEKVNVFLSLWAAGFEADTEEELDSIMELAWEAEDEIEWILKDYNTSCPPGHYYMLMNWESTGHRKPAGRWRYEIFARQRMRLVEDND